VAPCRDGGLEDEAKRGRPDIVHLCLLEATSIPLYREGRIQIYVHTIRDRVIRAGANVSLPRSCCRFQGVVEKLFREGRVGGGAGPLLELRGMTFPELVREMGPSRVVGLTREGAGSSCPDVAGLLDGDACLATGGFQKGRFAESTKRSIGELYRIDGASLDAHVVAGRILYEYEKTIFM